MAQRIRAGCTLDPIRVTRVTLGAGILRRMRRLLALPAAITVAVAVAACGGGTKTPPATAISDAPAKTADAGTARLEATVVTTSSKTPTTAAAKPTKVTGQVDFKATRGRFQISAASLGLPAGSGPLDAVLIGQIFYFKGLQGLTAPNKPWIEINLAKLANASGVAGQLQSLNPNSYLIQLRGVTGAVKELGKAKVRGTATTHYGFTVDLNKAAGLAPADQRAAIEAAAKTVVNQSEPTEVWLDGKGRVRRLQQTVQLASSLATGTTTLVLEYFDFGTKVDATPPPADQTSDFTSLLGGTGGG
jgi:hypothetical protein